MRTCDCNADDNENIGLTYMAALLHGDHKQLLIDQLIRVT